MRVLVVPMSAVAETSGPGQRCKLIVEGLKAAGGYETEQSEVEIDVATCMAEDVNYRKIEGVKNYFLDVPMPMGLPKFIAMRTFPMAQKLGITSKKAVRSFDEVLRITGNLDYKYLKKSVASIRRAIAEYKPDVVYSEFNISAIVAAKAEDVILCSSVSFPTQYAYAHDSRYAGGVNRLLSELRLPRVYSALQLFDWADVSFCPSIEELEPIEREDVIYCGTLKRVSDSRDSKSRNKILVYMGNGTVPATHMLEVVKGAFQGSDKEVYVASAYLEKETDGDIHVDARWDFSKLLPESCLYINHGGQNSMVDGLLYGVPQIVVPGKVFERQYNADSIVKNNAGVRLETRDFTGDKLKEVAERLIDSKEMRRNAENLGKKLLEKGGVDLIAEVIRSI